MIVTSVSLCLCNRGVTSVDRHIVLGAKFGHLIVECNHQVICDARPFDVLKPDL